MVYLWIFLGLIIAIVGLGVANAILTKVKNKKIKKGEKDNGHS